MKRFTLLLMLAILLAGAQPAAAQTSPITAYVSSSRSDIEPGDAFTLTLSIYTTNPALEQECFSLPIDTTRLRVVDVEATPTGAPSNPFENYLTWCGGARFEHPITVNIHLQALPGAPYGLVNLAFTIDNRFGGAAAPRCTVRIGTFPWAPSGHWRYLPIVFG